MLLLIVLFFVLLFIGAMDNLEEHNRLVAQYEQYKKDLEINEAKKMLY